MSSLEETTMQNEKKRKSHSKHQNKCQNEKKTPKLSINITAQELYKNKINKMIFKIMDF